MYLMAAVPSYGTGSKHGCDRPGSDAGAECRTASTGSRNGGHGHACSGTSANFSLLEIDENDNSFPWGLIHHSELAHMLNNGLGKTMVIDSRSFLEYNTSTIQQSVNVCCSKLVKRRLQQDKVQVLDLLNQACNAGADASWDVIVYDQCTEDPSQLTSDNFVQVLLHKLSTTFNSVAFLKGGFLTFQASHPSLVESKSSSQRCSTLTSLSQPCMPVSNVGPTRILPFLYLGSQQDSLNQEVAQVNGISYILNVSKTCPRPQFILENHFHRIPVNDNYCEKLLPYFQEAFQFLDKVREANGCVLVHCLGGVSRSATLAIAYIMRYMRMSSDEAYRYVKDKRPTISPNFNFLGQLLEYEKLLKEEEAKRKAEKAILDDDSMGDVDRASPCVMDLHMTSPSSPGPRTAHRSFNVEFPPPAVPTSQALPPNKFSSQECPFPGPSNNDNTYLVLGQAAKASAGSTSEGSLQIPTRPKMECDLPPFPRSTPESCPLPGPSPELCTLPGPSYQNRLYSRAVCVNAFQNNLLTSVTSKPIHTNHDQENMTLGIAPLCDSCVGQDSQPAVQSPMCPVTGFPCPGDEHQGIPESTCHSTGFPGPGHFGSSDFLGTGPAAETTAAFGHDSGHITVTKTETKTLFKNNSTYHNHIESSKDVSGGPVSPLTQSKGPDLDLSPKSAQKEQGKRAGFSLSSVFSNFRWKSRPPSLPLGSPVGSVKEGGRFKKKHSGEVSSGSGDGRVQLTPVSEAVENCDLNSSDDTVTNISETAEVLSKSQINSSEAMEKDDVSYGIDVSDPPGSSHSNATPVAMASTQNVLSSVSLPSECAASLCLTTASATLASESSSLETSNMYRSTHLKLKAKNFTLSLSSPTSEYHGRFAPSSLSLPSPGDSNKRKSFFPFSSNSPDKLAKTEDSRHSLTPPRTLNLSQGPVGKLRQKLSSKRSFVLPISSPTAAMARLNVASPADPSKDFPFLAADNGHHDPTTDDLWKMSGTNLQGEKNCKDIGCKGAHATLSPRSEREDHGLNMSLSQGRLSNSHGDNNVKTVSSCRHQDSDHRLNVSIPQGTVSSKQSDHHSVFHSNNRTQFGRTKWRSTSSLSVKTSCMETAKNAEETTVSGQVETFPKQQSDTSVFSSMVGSSSSVSAMSLSSSSFLSKSCTSISSSSMSSSSVSEMSSSHISSSSCSRNLQGFSQFPTTSLDKLSFTPCYTKDIVQELKKQESPRHMSVDQASSSDGNMGPSALDSPMSISSGSSAPSIASSTLSPVETGMTNPFSEASTFNTNSTGDSSMTFQTHIPSPSDSTAANTFRHSQDTPDAVLSPSSTSEFILSPSSMPQATLAPVIPTLSSPYYCSSSSVEPLSPMSLSDSSSSSPIRSPITNSITSPLLSTVSSPVSSLSSPVVTSPVSSSSQLSAIASSMTSKVVLRRDKNKRVMDRPNSIAFSSYPTCDLVPNIAGSSESGPGSQASQDDASEAYMSGSSKRSRLNITTESHTPHGRTSWGGYSEREVYRQITAAMESAMLQTHALTPKPSRNGRLAPARVTSRKARSLDDILDGNADDDEFVTSGGRSQRWTRYTDQPLFDQYGCGMRSGSEPYHSSSSLSSNGSHGSSLEIIQVS